MRHIFVAIDVDATTLKAANQTVYTFDGASPTLDSDIDSVLLNHLNEDIDLTFVGTGVAKKLSEQYGAKWMVQF